MYKVDLHTHSVLSNDGGITKKQYKKIFKSGVLDCVAITDHGTIDFALELHEELGDKIIIGEEIMTQDGEIIGLFLKKQIPSGLALSETVKRIKSDGGLVYVPHPFEKLRSGLQEGALREIIEDIDIFEVFNARGFLRGKALGAESFAMSNSIPMASSSDAHCMIGIGSAFSVLEKIPGADNLAGLLGNGKMNKKYASLLSYFCPGLNKIKNKISGISI
jgi:predicted metal-dependent phosphoesterase TrpH